MVQASPRLDSCVRGSDVRRASQGLKELVARLDADAVVVAEAAEVWAEFDAVERIIAAAKTLLARKVEDAATWPREGFRSAAEQLASWSGSSIGSAKAMLATSKLLVDLPQTAEAMRTGELSAPKASVVAAAAAIAPDAEAGLLDTAFRKPLAQVRDACLAARAVDRDAAHRRIHKNRYAREYVDAEGGWNFRARGTLEDGARFNAVHRPAIDEQFKAAKAEDRREPVEAYAFDAFIALAERAGGNRDTEPPKQKRPSGNVTAIMRVDITALRRGVVEGDELCEIVGLGPIPVRVARELLGDAILKLVITKGVDVANVTHLGRSATMAQQVALWWQSPSCTVDDCTRTHRLENDHGPDWVQTRHTRVDELWPLCGHHHFLKTHRGWALISDNGKHLVVPPDDPRHPKQRPPPGATCPRHE